MRVRCGSARSRGPTPRLNGVSDIPIGSPPAPPGRHAAPSGWYPDPANAGAERWWDGWQWSRNTRAREGAPPPPPISQPSPASGPAYPSGAHPPNPYAGYPGQPGAYPAAAYGRAPVGTADGIPLAGWWLRALAVVVDAVIVGTVAGLLSFPVLQRVAGRLIAFVQETMASGGPPSDSFAPPLIITTSESLLITAVQLVVALAYHVLFLRTKAATPGKLVTGLRVVPVDRGRSTTPLGWGTVTVRALVWLVPMVNGLLMAVRLVDALFPLWQPKRQSLHDLAAKTQVVRVR